MVALDLGTGGELSSSTHCDGAGTGDIFAYCSRRSVQSYARFKSSCCAVCCAVFDIVGGVQVEMYNLVGSALAPRTRPTRPLKCRCSCVDPNNFDLPQIPE